MLHRSDVEFDPGARTDRRVSAIFKPLLGPKYGFRTDSPRCAAYKEINEPHTVTSAMQKPSKEQIAIVKQGACRSILYVELLNYVIRPRPCGATAGRSNGRRRGDRAERLREPASNTSFPRSSSLPSLSPEGHIALREFLKYRERQMKEQFLPLPSPAIRRR